MSKLKTDNDIKLDEAKKLKYELVQLQTNIESEREMMSHQNNRNIIEKDSL